MGYYPLFLELAKRPCIVIGGGPVAQRKVEGLLATGATVTVVSPALTAALAELRDRGLIRHLPRQYLASDLAGFSLAFVATDDGAVNAQVAAEGRQRGIWVNAVDDPAHCDFIIPSVVRRGELVIAISTGGGSPALARRVREELEEYFGSDYSQLLELAAEVRQELRRRGHPVDAEIWNATLTPELRRLLAAGEREEARRRLLEGLLTKATREDP